MVAENEALKRLENYDRDNLVIATLCSHTSLQIFDGARKEGFKTLGISIGEPSRYYDAFPGAKPDDFFVVDEHSEIPGKAD
jgi:5-formaminoimidazole-4-carboxamide-1-(beta)-D-ribofuranosyl 5'-monophosphate synthetase